MARERTTSKGRNFVDIYGDYHTGYTHKTKSGRHQINLAQELHDVLNEYANDLIAEKEAALDEAADYLVQKYEQASPSKTGNFKNSWVRTDKYVSVRYVGNTAVAGKNKTYGGNIPLSNIIEFSKNGKPFMRKTFESNKNTLIDIIVDRLNKTK